MRPQLRSLAQTLAAVERTRAERFVFQEHRERYIVTRGLLRTILGRYLNLGPDQLEFWHNRFGKPALTTTCGGEQLRFNLSHSDDIVLYAIAGREVGVDVERIRPDFVSEAIAKRFFSPREVAVLQALPPQVRTEAFYNCWTRKEAYVKAKGKGMSIALNDFDVAFAPGEPPALLYTSWDTSEASRWSIHALAPDPGHVAALAVEGRRGSLQCWRWT